MTTLMKYNQEGLGKIKGQQLLAFQRWGKNKTKTTMSTQTPLPESLSAGL